MAQTITVANRVDNSQNRKPWPCKRAFGVTEQGLTNGYVSGEHFMIAARVFWTHQVESALRHVGGSTSAETDSDRS